MSRRRRVLIPLALTIAFIMAGLALSPAFNIAQAGTIAQPQPRQLLAAGNYHGLAVTAAGTVWTWGNNRQGQLGQGIIHDFGPGPDWLPPMRVPGLSGVVSVAAGEQWSFALKDDGTVWAWGIGGDPLGDGSGSGQSAPVALPNLTDITALDAGPMHSMAITAAGTVMAWGLNNHGQLGNGTNINQPVAVPVPGLNGIAAVAAGGHHSLAVRSDGKVFSWGRNNYGQLGDGTVNGRTTPAEVNGLPPIVAVAAGDLHSLALAADGTVWAWGDNRSGRLGDGTAEQRRQPVQVIGLSAAAQISARADRSGAVTESGQILTWGVGTAGNVPSVQSGLGRGIFLRAGYSHFMAVDADGTVWGWGQNDFNRLGTSFDINKSVPIPAQTVRVAGVGAAAAIDPPTPFYATYEADTVTLHWALESHREDTEYYAELLDQTGVAVAGSGWLPPKGGSIESYVFDQLTPATYYRPRLKIRQPDQESPWYTLPLRPTWRENVAVPGVVGIAAARDHSLAIFDDGSAKAWGYNANGQLGNGTTQHQSVPVRVNNLTDAQGLLQRTGWVSLALGRNGTVYGWGLADAHFVLPRENDWLTPIALQGFQEAVLGSGNGAVSFIVDSSRRVWGWGSDLTPHGGGAGFLSGRVPQLVPAWGDITAMSVGTHHSVVVRSDGRVWAAGKNSSGQLGDGTFAERTVPVQVSNLSGIVAVAAGDQYTIALGHDGTVFSWGSNSDGALGLGLPAAAVINVPSPVTGPVAPVAIAAGLRHTLVLEADGTVWAWGSNSHGQLGTGLSDGPGAAGSAPAKVLSPDGAGPLGNVVAVAAGEHHSLALLANGVVLAWGRNNYGQLGDGSTVNRRTPVAVKGLTWGPPTGVGFTVTSSTVTGTWHTEPYPNDTEYRAELLTAGGGIAAQTDWTARPGHTFTGLDPNTEYRLRVWARRADEPPAAATAPPQYTWAANPVLGSVTASDVSLTVNLNADNNPAYTDYRFELRVGGGEAIAESPWSTVRGFTFTELTPGTAYGLFAQARNMGGALTPVVHLGQFSTEDPPRPLQPPAGGFLTAGATQISVRWNGAMPLDGVEYEVELLSGLAEVLSASGWLSDVSYIFEQLAPNTVYFARLRARDQNRVSEWVELPRVYTLAAMPALGALTAGVQELKVSWQGNGNPEGTQYLAQIETDDGQLIGTSGWIAVPGYAFGSLLPNRAYTVRVRARNWDGIETNWTPAARGTTRMPPVYQPKAGEVLVTETGYTGKWEANGNYPGSEYYAELLDNNGRVLASSGWIFATEYTAAGLEPNTRYQMQVKARFGTQESPWLRLGTRYTWAAPPAPKAIQGNLQVEWLANGNPFGTAYFIEVTDADNLPVAAFGWSIATGHKFSGLPAATAYSVWGRARNKDQIETVRVLLGITEAAPAPAASPKPLPPAPDTVTVTDTTYTAVWGAGGNPPAAEYQIELRDVANRAVATSGWISDRSYTFTELAPNTRYRAYVKARLANIESGPTGLAQRHTLAAPPEPAGLVSGIGRLTARWNGGGNPFGTAYNIELRLPSGLAVTKSGWLTATMYEFLDLPADALYEAYVQAKNGDGLETDWIFLGVSAVLPLDLPPAPVWVVQKPGQGLPSVTTNSYLAMWAAHHNPEDTEYQVELQNAARQVVAVSEWVRDTQYEFTGLTANTRYQARIRARIGDQLTEWITLVQLCTLAAEPAPGAVTVGSDTVTAYWSAGVNPWGTQYRAELRRAQGAAVITAPWQIASTIKFPNLLPDHYDVYVQARNFSNVETNWVWVATFEIP